MATFSCSAADIQRLRKKLQVPLRGPTSHEVYDTPLPRTPADLRKALRVAQQRAKTGATEAIRAKAQQQAVKVRTALLATKHGRKSNTPDEPARVVERAIGDGWSSWPIEVETILAPVSKLRLRPGWSLCAYVFRSGGNGNGLIWALPPNAPTPPYHHESNLPLSKGPRPPEAQRPCSAIEGDGSLESYLQASILRREIREFAALWHGVSWGDVDVIDAPPRPWREPSASEEDALNAQDSDELTGGRPIGPWEWAIDPPTSPLCPQATHHPDGGTRVILHTVSGVGGYRLSEQIDYYPVNSYISDLDRSSYRVLASARGGYVF